MEFFPDLSRIAPSTEESKQAESNSLKNLVEFSKGELLPDANHGFGFPMAKPGKMKPKEIATTIFESLTTPSTMSFLKPTLQDAAKIEALHAGEPKTKPKPVVVLDSDETIGSWSDLSLLYCYFLTVLQKEPCPHRFVEIAIATGAMRPHLDDFLMALLDMKKSGQVGAIVLMTAAPNEYGWVSFLVRVLEVWLKLDEAVFDLVLAKEQIEEWNKRRGIAHNPKEGLSKDIHQVLTGLALPLDTPTLMFEDRPHLVHNATHLVQVPPYNVAINLVEVACTFLDKDEWTPEHACHWSAVFSETWDEFKKHPDWFTRPTELDTSLKTHLATVEVLVQSRP